MSTQAPQYAQQPHQVPQVNQYGTPNQALLNVETQRNVLKLLLEKIETKNSWGKNELKSEILNILIN